MTDPQLQQMTATLDELDGRERALRAELDALRGRMVEWTQAEYLKAQRYWDDYRRTQGAPPLACSRRHSYCRNGFQSGGTLPSDWN
ncbi:MAG: hypothetical protein ACRDDJ_20525 [[Mycobacterium] stephanolepidis]